MDAAIEAHGAAAGNGPGQSTKGGGAADHSLQSGTIAKCRDRASELDLVAVSSFWCSFLRAGQP